MQGAVLVDEGLRLHLYQARRELLGAYSEGGAARGDCTRGEVRHLRSVGLGREPRHGHRQLGAVRVAVDVGGALNAVDHVTLARGHHREVADGKDVGEATGTRGGARAAVTGVAGVAAVAAVAGVATNPAVCDTLREAPAKDEPGRGRLEVAAILCQLLVDLVVERRAQRRIGGEIGHHQRHERDRPDREEESEPERHSGCSAGRFGFPEGVADETDGVDERRPELLELLAQVADVGLHDVAVATEVVVPDMVQDL